jgi:polysaccharide deacetylase 2 family uncharacterized protein YibQ
MRFIPKFRPKSLTSKFSPSTVVVGVLTFFIVTSVVSVISGLFIGKQKRIEESLLNAQRIEVDLSSGEIYGNILLTEEFVEKVATSKSSSKDSKVNESKQESEQFVWVNEDFIGPRMPKSFVDGMIAEVMGRMEVERVALKDLSDKPIIVIVLKGLGLSASTTERAMELPPVVTFGLSPYSSDIENWAKKAKAQGREIILNIPMETKDFRLNDPGPYALLTQSTKEDNITRLNMLLGLINGYEAVYSEKDEIFTHTLSSSRPILKELKKKGVFMVFGSGYADFSLIQLSDELEYPLLVNDFILDEDISQRAINDKFDKIEEAATEKGYVIVMANPYPLTIRMLERWIPQVEERGYLIAPVSLLLGKKIVK